MITVSIGTAERPLLEATPAWVNEQLSRRYANGDRVCIRVRIDESGVLMSLTSHDCPRANSNYRPPSPLEQQIFDIWQFHRLDESDVNAGRLIPFLERLRGIL